jgi:streptomycin 6-kinase
MAALSAQAEAQGLTLEDWFKALAAREASAAHCRRIAQEAAARILETQDRAKPGPD